MTQMVFRVMASAVPLALLAAPALAQAPGLAMLDTLPTGEWVFNDADQQADRILCVTDWRRILQLQHQAARCTRFTIEDAPGRVRVNYSCGTAGNGQTTIRRETTHLVQIDTQGIEGGMPFSYSYEARYAGACRSGAPRQRR